MVDGIAWRPLRYAGWLRSIQTAAFSGSTTRIRPRISPALGNIATFTCLRGESSGPEGGIQPESGPSPGRLVAPRTRHLQKIHLNTGHPAVDAGIESVMHLRQPEIQTLLQARDTLLMGCKAPSLLQDESPELLSEVTLHLDENSVR